MTPSAPQRQPLAPSAGRHGALGGRYEGQRHQLPPTLQGLLILMVSYLRTSELTYSSRDWEVFPKAYLPLNVKNPFRLLFRDLLAEERRVFDEVYDNPRRRVLEACQARGYVRDAADQLFPAVVAAKQAQWFSSIPTWNDFVEKTVTNTPLLRTEAGPMKGARM